MYCVTDKLMRQIGLKDNAAVVDLTRSKVTVESLTETRVMCAAEDKVKGRMRSGENR